VRDDEVRAAWAWIDSVSDAWKAASLPLQPYPAGEWGPAEAAGFLPAEVDADAGRKDGDA
jgi:glucose-6-phosphate 1-dehydrogenase